MVAQATKSGYVYVFDRVTGEPIWDIEEVPVPQSDVPGEQTSPTQPIPTVPPPFTRHRVTIDNINPFYSDEKKEAWKKRLAEAKTDFFSPHSDKYETIVIPGAVGGANFGNTASNPDKGLLYVISHEYPSVYKLEKVEPPVLSKEEVKAATGLYSQFCKGCHGANLEGAAAPALKGAGNKVSWEEFQSIISAGKGQMPGFPHIDEKGMDALYKYLGGVIRRRRSFNSDGEEQSVDGPVVASGGAPVRPGSDRNLYGRGGMRAYPEGVPHPEDQYRSGYGLEYMDLMSPPWTSIFAYDLNAGTIKWRKPIGENFQIESGRDTAGIPGGPARKGMLVTSSGIVFSTIKGGQIYAFDEDNGELLWKYQLSKETMGLPAMYEVDSRDYIVVSATASFTEHSKDWSKELNALPSGYVVFALPSQE